jgi:hypothetical protein
MAPLKTQAANALHKSVSNGSGNARDYTREASDGSPD